MAKSAAKKMQVGLNQGKAARKMLRGMNSFAKKVKRNL